MEVMQNSLGKKCLRKNNLVPYAMKYKVTVLLYCIISIEQNNLVPCAMETLQKML